MRRAPRRLAPLGLVALVAGCTCTLDAPAPASVTSVYECADGARFTAEFEPAAETVTITRAGAAPVLMRQTVSASGVRFTDGAAVFHAKGRTAHWIAGGTTVIGCREIARS